MSKNIVYWLGHGERGASSECMALTALGVVPSLPFYPADGHDLRRCALLLKSAPEVREAFPMIREISPEWAGIIDHWDELIELLLSEIGENMPWLCVPAKTGRLMRKIIDEARRK